MVKKGASLLLLAIASTVFIANVFAEEIHESSKKQISLKTTDTIEVGLQNYWYKYEETVNKAFFMSNTGYKYGASLTGIKTFADNFYLTGDLRYATGDVAYKSASGKGDVSDNMYEARMMIGCENIVNNSYLLASFIGFGYRQLDNDLRDLGSGGYRRTSQYLYIPLGVTHRFMLNQTSRVSSGIEYDWLIKGAQTSYLSDVSPADAALFGDVVNKQKHGYGVRINTAYEQLHWSIGLFYNYWKINDSDKNYYTDGIYLYTLMEPKNETQEIGLELKYRF